jgi:hypothetical protein
MNSQFGIAGFQPTLKGMENVFYIQIYEDVGSATYVYDFSTPFASEIGIANISYSCMILLSSKYFCFFPHNLFPQS